MVPELSLSDEIIGFHLLDRGLISNDPRVICEAIDANERYQLVSRWRVQMMSYCDFGKKWDDLAKWPTLCRSGDLEAKFGEVIEGQTLWQDYKIG